VETKRKSTKGRQLAGISRILEASISSCRTAWLAMQWKSNLSLAKFPANREFYREICDF
jgi:hypothetical protein